MAASEGCCARAASSIRARSSFVCVGSHHLPGLQGRDSSRHQIAGKTSLILCMPGSNHSERKCHESRLIYEELRLIWPHECSCLKLQAQKSSQDSHLAPNTCRKFRFGPLSKGHCVTRCFSNISIVVTLSHTMRACIPSSPPRLRANAISTMNANRVSANLRQLEIICPNCSRSPLKVLADAVSMINANRVSPGCNTQSPSQSYLKAEAAGCITVLVKAELAVVLAQCRGRHA